MICNYCQEPVEIMAYRLGEAMCLDCAKSAFYKVLENGNQMLVTKKQVSA
jgi:hypothetical protein